MAHSDFSWRKIFSFFGAGLLIFVAFAAMATGINLMYEGVTFYGIMATIGGVASGTLAVLLYRNYTKWADENLSNVKK